MGWGMFIIAYGVLAVTLFCPGYLALRSLRLPRQEALCLAPVATVAVFVLLGLAYASLGVGGSYLTVVLAPSAVLFVVCLLRRPWKRPLDLAEGQSWLAVVLYVIVGVVLTFFFFAGNLEGDLAAFQPDNDNSFHLNLIKSISESGRYSILGVSVYAASPTAPFTGSGSFYPAAFHLVAAAVVNLLDLSVSLAENALGAVVMSLVWPLGVYWTLSHIFHRDHVAVLCGSFACMTLVSFPWRFFTWGPLFPNMFSLALVPAALGTFMEWAEGRGRQNRIGRSGQALLFFVALCAIAAAHPNGVFTLGMLVGPYVVSLICKAPASAHDGVPRAHSWARKIVLILAFLVLVAAAWVGMYLLPALRSVTRFVWAPYEDFGFGLLDAITLKTAGNRVQVPMMLLLFAGFGYALYRWRDYGWMTVLFVLVALQFAVSASLTGTIRQLLCGFWYTDPNRIAANVALAAVPLVSLGMSATLALLRHALRATDPLPDATVTGLLLVTMGLLLGSSAIAHNAEHEDGFQLATTASYDFSNMLEYKYSSKTPKGYDASERAFVDQVLETVPEGTLLLNLPNDGSCFAYALQDANVYYKDVTSPGIYNNGQTETARIIRRNLYHLSDYTSVQEAVRSLEAHYLLILDQGQGTQDDAKTLPVYYSSEWRGIVSIDDDTPGFEVVLAEGDMRLYRLVY